MLIVSLATGIVVAVAAGVTPAGAQTVLTWTGSSPANPTHWSTSTATTSWSGATAFWVQGDSAVFGSTGLAAGVTTATGVTASGITFAVDGWNVMGTSVVTFLQNSTVTLDGTTGDTITAPVTLANASGATAPGQFTVTGSAPLTIAGTFSDSQGNAGGDSNTFFVTNNSSGALTLSGGLVTSSTSTTTNSRILNFNGSGATVITGTSLGNSTDNLTFVASGSGPVIVNTGGNLSSATALGGNGLVAGASLTVAAGSTVGGSGGNVGALVMAAQSAILAPGMAYSGSAATTATLNGTSLTASSGLTYNLNVNGSSAVSTLTLSGITTLGTGVALTLNINDLGGSTLQAGVVYDIITGSGTGAGSLGSVNFTSLDPSAFTLNSSYGDNGVLYDASTDTLSVEFEAAAIPEPSTWLLLLAGAGILFFSCAGRKLFSRTHTPTSPV